VSDSLELKGFERLLKLRDKAKKELEQAQREHWSNRELIQLKSGYYHGIAEAILALNEESAG